MSDISVFSYSDIEIRTVVRDGEPWFVIADLCRVLALSNPTVVADRLDDDDLSTAEVIDSMGRTQAARVTTEAGVYQLVFMSRKPEAKAFKRWVTHEVLPAIRKTGRYESAPVSVASIGRRELAQMVIEAEDRAAAAEQALTAVAPKVEAWNTLAAAAGDYSVKEAAQTLSRHPFIEVGQNRLFAHLEQFGWIYRRHVNSRWQVYQKAIDTGWLGKKVTSYEHPRTGETVLDTQVRVTVKGLAELHRRLTGTQGEIAA